MPSHAITCLHMPAALCCTGVLYRELGNMERAMQCYQAALNARPNFPQASPAMGPHGMHGIL